VLEGLYETDSSAGHDLSQGDVEAAIRLAIAQGLAVRLRSREPRVPRSRSFKPAQSAPVARTHRRAGRHICARSNATSSLFGVGPGGTGKTWLAVAHAVCAVSSARRLNRIVLSRPASRGGRAARLPCRAICAKRCDPYLRPIYDALFDLMDARIVGERADAGRPRIEIAPTLAFMRGRTLANAVVVILDEAQNTTSMQNEGCFSRAWVRTAA